MSNDNLRKLQLCEIGILKQFIKICDKENLKYFIGGGTLLGAIRHKGFIPWDDDIDIYMPRKDYEKFIFIANKKLNFNTKLVNFLNDENVTHYQSIIINQEFSVKLNHTTNGIERNAWIDIWPLDYMPQNKISFIIRKYKILYRRFRYQASVFDIMVDTKKKRNLLEKILIFLVGKLKIGKNSNPNKMLKKLDTELKKNVHNPKYYLNGMSVYKFKNLMPINVYGEGTLYDFENIKVKGPNNYNYFLTRLYGDYMIPPSEKDKNRHHLVIIENGDKK